MRHAVNVGRRSIFAKLVFIFLMIMTPVFGTGLYINEFASRSVADEITLSMDSKIEFYMKLLEVDLSKIIQFQQQYVNDSDLLELSGGWEFMSYPDRAYASERLQRRLLLLQSSSLYIKRAAVYLPAMERSVSAYNSFDDFDEKEFEGLLRTNGSRLSHFTYWNDRLFLNMTAPGWSYRDGEDPIYLLSVELSIPRIRELLGQIGSGGEGESVLASPDNGWSVSSAEGSAEPDRRSWVSTSIHSTELNLTLSAFVPETIAYGKLKQYKKGYWLLSGLAVAAMIVFALWIHRVIHNPLSKLVRAFRHLEEGNLNVAVKHHAHDEFRYVFRQFNGTVAKLDALIKDVFEQKYRAQLSELRQLQSQINPHFLYNSFFNLQLMAKLRDHDNIERFTAYLGEYFLYITRNASSEASLAEEVEHSRRYTQIQSFRFKGRIAAEFGELPAEARDVRVPRLILQPLIENAYKHGLESKKALGRLRVCFESVDDALAISIEDNGEALSDERIAELSKRLALSSLEAETTGMINVSRRLRLKFGDAAGLAIDRGPLGGMRATVRVPLRRNEEERDREDLNTEGKRHVPTAHRG